MFRPWPLLPAPLLGVHGVRAQTPVITALTPAEDPTSGWTLAIGSGTGFRPSFAGAPATAWRAIHDARPDLRNLVELPAAADQPIFRDVGAVSRGGDEYDHVRGVSPRSPRTPGP